MHKHRLNKKGAVIGGGLLLFYITIVVAIILAIFVISSAVIKSYYHVPVGVGSQRAEFSDRRAYFLDYIEDHRNPQVEFSFESLEEYQKESSGGKT